MSNLSSFFFTHFLSTSVSGHACKLCSVHAVYFVYGLCLCSFSAQPGWLYFILSQQLEPGSVCESRQNCFQSNWLRFWSDSKDAYLGFNQDSDGTSFTGVSEHRILPDIGTLAPPE